MSPPLAVASLIPSVPGEVHLLSGGEQARAGVPVISEERWWTASSQQL